MLKEFYSERSYKHQLDYTINILLYFLEQISIHLSSVLLFDAFQVYFLLRVQYFCIFFFFWGTIYI